MTAAVIALAVVVAVLAVLVVGLLRSHALVLRHLHDAGLDLRDLDPSASDRAAALTGADVAEDQRTPRPTRTTLGRDGADVVGTTPDGGSVAVRVTDVDHDTLLLFLSSDCATCRRFWEALHPDAPDVRRPADVRVVVVTKGPEHESPWAVDQHHVDVPVVMSDDAWRSFEVPGSPYAVHVDGPSGRVVGEGTGASWDQLADLLAQATGDAGYVTAATGRKARRDRIAEQDTDAALLAAGILPGDPRLHPEMSEHGGRTTTTTARQRRRSPEPDPEPDR